MNPRNNVYYGKDIWEKIRRTNHFESFQVRAKLKKGPYGDAALIIDGVEPPYEQIRVFVPDSNPSGSTKWWKPMTEIVASLKDGNDYIFTIYTRHHQQMLNVTLLTVNFDCENKEILDCWMIDQFYPGYPIYTDPHWNEWGEPWPTDKELEEHNAFHKDHPYWQWTKDGDKLVRKYPEAYAEYIKPGFQFAETPK